jgi:hypothetical protein
MGNLSSFGTLKGEFSGSPSVHGWRPLAEAPLSQQYTLPGKKKGNKRRKRSKDPTVIKSLTL